MKKRRQRRCCVRNARTVTHQPCQETAVVDDTELAAIIAREIFQAGTLHRRAGQQDSVPHRPERETRSRMGRKATS